MPYTSGPKAWDVFVLSPPFCVSGKVTLTFNSSQALTDGQPRHLTLDRTQSSFCRCMSAHRNILQITVMTGVAERTIDCGAWMRRVARLGVRWSFGNRFLNTFPT